MHRIIYPLIVSLIYGLGSMTIAYGMSWDKSPIPVFPDKVWEYDLDGLPSDVVSDVDSFIQTLETTGLLVVVGGKIVYEYGDVAEVSYIASVRKSVLSMLIGSYVANGDIRLDATLEELGMSDVGGLLPIELKAKFIDLIMARSGMYRSAYLAY